MAELIQVWSLERYARQVSTEKTPEPNVCDWEYFDNQEDHLELTLVSTGQLLVHCGRKQLENVNLSDSSISLKGINKGDSIMVIQKQGNRSHRFRMKFSSHNAETGEERCRVCVNQLAKYFPIKVSGNNVTGLDHSQINSTPLCTPTDVQTLSGDVTLGQMTEAVLNPNTHCLPSVYKDLHMNTDCDLNTAIKLCLTDPSFPAFVGQVETVLKTIQTDCEQ